MNWYREPMKPAGVSVARWLIAATIAIGAVGGAYLARAGVSCSVPFQLQNNTTADATQVMANYNALITCLGNAAAAGSNSDITALNALTTPITPAGGGSTAYIGGTSGGTANAQTVSSTTPTGFTLAAGKRVTFIAGFANTGATTLNVVGTGAVNIYRRTQLGISAMVGGELVAGQLAEVIYDGTQFQLLSSTFIVGEGRDWFTNTAPAGWSLRDGSALSRTIYADLFGVIGTTYGAGDGSTTFNVPDERGRVAVGRDTAGRITTSCSASATLGTPCGNSNAQGSLTQANLPNVTFTVTIPGGQGNHSHNFTNGPNAPSGGSGAGVGAGQTVNSATPSSIDAATLPGMSGTATSGGSGTAFNTGDPGLIVNKIIKY